MPEPKIPILTTCVCELPFDWRRALLYLPGLGVLALDLEAAGKGLLLLLVLFLVQALFIEGRIRKLTFNGSVVTLVRGAKIATRGPDPWVLNRDLEVGLGDFAWRVEGGRLEAWDGASWRLLARGSGRQRIVDWLQGHGLGDFRRP